MACCAHCKPHLTTNTGTVIGQIDCNGRTLSKPSFLRVRESARGTVLLMYNMLKTPEFS
jgi:hypothetical protein